MDEEVEKRIKALENRINDLEEQIDSIDKIQYRTIKTFEHFSEITNNNMAALGTKVQATYEKTDATYRMLKGY